MLKDAEISDHNETDDDQDYESSEGDPDFPYALPDDEWDALALNPAMPAGFDHVVCVDPPPERPIAELLGSSAPGYLHMAPAGAGKLFLSLHYYTPFDFTLMEEPADWGGMVYPRTTWGSAEDEAELQRLFGTLAAFSAERNIPIIIGEFAVSPGSGEYIR